MIKDGSYNWKGTFSYNEEEYGHQDEVAFELFVQVKSSIISGVCYDEEFRDYHKKDLPVVKGRLEDQTIYFTISYPVGFSIDEEKNLLYEPTGKGHDVHYAGVFDDLSKRCFGIWEILPSEEEVDGQMVYQDYSTGEWEILI